MTISPPESRPPGPHLLPLPPSSAGSVAAIIESLAAEVAADRRARRQPPVAVEVDAAAGRRVAGDPALVREAVAPLLAAACEASATAHPRLRAVVVTIVDTGPALEIEVADSGPDTARGAAVVERVGPPVARLGGSVARAPCPEGGLAVTLRLPHPQCASRAA